MLIGNALSEDSIVDDDYYAMAQTLSSIMDCVSGYDFIMNWIDILSDNVTVCYPFVAQIDDEYCLYGLEQVKQAWIPNTSMTNYSSTEQTRFYISKYPPLKLGVWHYTTSASYLSDDYGSCSVQFSGVVNFALDPTNTSLILKWLETPDSNRINNTYPCQK